MVYGIYGILLLHSTVFICSWRKIGEFLTEQSHGLESELPAPLSDIVQWLSVAEQLIRRSLDIRTDVAQQSLLRIAEVINNHKVDFKQVLRFFMLLFSFRIGK